MNIFNTDGELLCEAELLPGAADEFVILAAPGPASALFAYYFFRSGKQVTLDLGEIRLTATLWTRWRDNHRIWWAEPLPVAPDQPPARDVRRAGGAPPPPLVHVV